MWRMRAHEPPLLAYLQPEQKTITIAHTWDKRGTWPPTSFLVCFLKIRMASALQIASSRTTRSWVILFSSNLYAVRALHSSIWSTVRAGSSPGFRKPDTELKLTKFEGDSSSCTQVKIFFCLRSRLNALPCRSFTGSLYPNSSPSI